MKLKRSCSFLLPAIHRVLLIASVVPAIMTMLIAGSCSADQGLDRLTELLYSQGYSAEIDFSLTGNGSDIIKGSAVVSKQDTVNISFSSPEAFEGLSVESNENGEADILMFNYYGMKIPLPDGALTKINLLLSFFSDEAASCLSSLPHGSVKDCDMPEGNFPDTAVPKSCIFELGDDIVCTLIFDAASGVPMQYTAVSGDISATINFTKIKYPS